MFGWLKKAKKHEDVDDIRSNVLDEEPLRRFERTPQDLEDPLAKATDRRFDPSPMEPDRFHEPPGFNTIDTRNNEKDLDKNYEIIDRLNLIETQLSAIRSQTETINERLKNLERSLPRRY